MLDRGVAVGRDGLRRNRYEYTEQTSTGASETSAWRFGAGGRVTVHFTVLVTHTMLHRT